MPHIVGGRFSILSAQTHVGQYLKSIMLLVHGVSSESEGGRKLSMEVGIKSPWSGKDFKDDEALELLGLLLGMRSAIWKDVLGVER